MVLFGVNFSAVQNFFGAISNLFNSLKQHIAHVLGVWDSAVKLRDSVLQEVEGWKNFKQDIRFKNRVVNLDTAVTKTRDLVQGIIDSWHSILNIIKQVRTGLSEANPQAAASELEQEFAQAAEASGIRGLFEEFPRLGRAFERAGVVLGAIFTAVEQVSSIIDDLQTIVDELRRARLEIERLDTIFLSQSNKRKSLKLADGSTIRIRVGKLHSSV